MKKILLFLMLIPAFAFSQESKIININPDGWGGVINIDPGNSLDLLLDSVQNWIWVSSDNQTGTETGTMIYPYNTIAEGVADIIDGSMMIIVTPLDGSAYDITDPIVIGYDNVIITGQGSSTIIDGDGLSTGEHAISITGKTSCVIMNLSVQTEDGGGKTSHCIFLDNGANGTIISNVTIIDSDSDGIHAEGTNTTDITVQDCNILDVDGNGIFVDMDAANTMTRMNIINNTVQSAGSVGISIRDYQYGNCNDNMVSTSTSHGILMALGVYNTVDGNVVYSNGGEGIQINGSTDITVSGNTATGNTNCGIEFTGNSYRCTASGNTMRTNQYGIYVESSARASVTGNITEGNSASGIFIDNSPSTAVTGNVSRNDDSGEGGGGIVVMDCDHVTVTGNTSSASTYNGLYLYNADYCVVTGNIFNENTIDGIYLSNAATYNVISSNECYGNTGDGIELAAAAEIGNIVLSNKLLGNGEDALEDNGAGTMLMHDNVAGIWNMGVAVQISDSLILDYTASANTLVLTPTATGRIDTLETADIATEAMTVTGLWTFDNVNIDSLQVDTLAVNTTIINEGSYNYGGAEAGGDDDYTISISGIAAYKAGMIVTFLATTDNTGACTLDVNSIGATAIKDQAGGDPADSYIDANSFVMVGYDGTNFVLLTPDANP